MRVVVVVLVVLRDEWVDNSVWEFKEKKRVHSDARLDCYRYG